MCAASHFTLALKADVVSEIPLRLRIRSPDFDPPEQLSEVDYDAESGSPTAAFLITARKDGRQRVTVEVLAQSRLLASRVLQTDARHSGGSPGRYRSGDGHRRAGTMGSGGKFSPRSGCRSSKTGHASEDGRHVVPVIT